MYTRSLNLLLESRGQVAPICFNAKKTEAKAINQIFWRIHFNKKIVFAFIKLISLCWGNADSADPFWKVGHVQYQIQ